ncbi:MAG: helix-turn-helix transcriptional regulator [Lachnospiraceae bacterium]|nr:helix-turn-helix transcriptional regulator [Lachnospiraceae bacterium]
MDLVDVGRRIKEKRMARKLTQEQLAERTNLSVAYIGMLERGKRTPSLETFIIIADELNVTADELLYGTMKSGYRTRLVEYEERLAKLNAEETRKFFGVIDVLLGMNQ